MKHLVRIASVTLAFLCGTWLGWQISQPGQLPSSSAPDTGIVTQAHIATHVENNSPALTAGNLLYAEMRSILELIETNSGEDIRQWLEKYSTTERTRQKRLQADFLFYRWAELNPQAAFTFLQNLPLPEKNAFMGTIFEAWASQTPQAACEVFVQLENNHMKENAFYGMMTGWLNYDLHEAINYMHQLPERSLRDEAPALLADFLSRTSPQDAIQHIAYIPEGEIKYQTYRYIAATWAKTDPNTAANWAAALHDENNRNAALAEVVSTWTHNDPAATADWLNHYHNTDLYDPAVARFATTLTRFDPHAAAEWAITIGNRETRQHTVSDILRHWLIHQPDSANLWISQNSWNIHDSPF